MPLLPGWGKLLSGMRDAAREQARLGEQRQALEALPDPKSGPGGYLGFAEELKKSIEPDDFFRLLKERLTVHPDQRAFTRTHAAIACLNIDGVVTTNFDSGLKQAQQRRFQLDPALQGSSLDEPCEVGLGANARDHIEAWLKSGREFSFGGKTNAPLYLHGSLASRRDVVFTASDYDRFYKAKAGNSHNTGAFFFEQLLGSTNLLFIGYSFTDPFIDTVMSKVAKRPLWQGDHFALFGVRKTDELDKQTKKLASLRITPIYYPVTAPDHPALQFLLDALGSHDCTLVDKMCERSVTASRDDVRSSLHETMQPAWLSVLSPTAATNKEEWDKLPGMNPKTRIERRSEMAILEKLASDIRVRIIGLVGLGGTGKTTLMRQILEDKGLAVARFPGGVLVHPVRDDAQADSVVDALYDKFPPSSPIDQGDRFARVEHARRVLRLNRVLLVLDGLELLQERPGQPEYGRFLSDDLRSLLLGLAREGQALVVITSRFPLVEFNDYVGKSFRVVELGGLTRDESIALLRNSGVSGDDETLNAVHNEFGGHPLGLALFAGAVTRTKASAFAGGSAEQALELLRNRGGASLDDRLVTLLDWYRDALSPAQLALLTLLAIYPASVSQAELRALLLAGRVRVGDCSLTMSDGERALDALERMRLIQFDIGQGRYECHAVVRREMRSIDHGTARTAISSLTGDAPIYSDVTTVEELQRVVDAIEIAIESLADFGQANRLLVARLGSGQRFLDLGVPHIGAACIGRIVADHVGQDGRTRREIAEAVLGKRTIGVYVAWMRQFHAMLGNLSEAERWRLIDGDCYINWSSADPMDDGVYRFWGDGLEYALFRGDGETWYRLRAETWERYGELVRRRLKDGTLPEDIDLSWLTSYLYDAPGLRRDDRWSGLSPEIAKQALFFPTLDLVTSMLHTIENTLSVFDGLRFETPAGTQRIQPMPVADLADLKNRLNRMKAALHKVRFIAIARTNEKPRADDLLDLLKLAPLFDESTERLVFARAMLAVAELCERARSRASVAFARSWAAEQLCYIGKAAAAAELAERALDVCGEHLQERARAIYMRGCSHLALGEFAAGLADAELCLRISRSGDWPFYIAGSLALRWLTARELADARAADWEIEYRAFCAQVYRLDEYEALPRFALLPGEAGFQSAFPHLDWPDELLEAVPAQVEVVEAIADGRFNDLLQRYRDDILKPFRRRTNPFWNDEV
jgi:hypothetical protein